MPSWFKDIGFSGLFDILIVTGLVYLVLVWFKRTKSSFVFRGILILGIVYLFARQFDLILTYSLFENFFGIIFIALVVIFQEELKHFFEGLAVWSLSPRFRGQKVLLLSREEVQTLVRTLVELSRDRIGALVVLKGRDLILRHLDGGIDVNGEMSEALLKSLFDPHSPGHDGALIIEGNRILQYSCHLPLSKNLKEVGKGGTRHAAALGLSELTDALGLVVSEERGTISVARNGSLEIVKDPEKLGVIIEKFYQEINPRTEVRNIPDLLRKNGREKIVALILASSFWWVFNQSASLTYKTFKVPVPTLVLPEPWKVESIDPEDIEVTFQGLRKDFYIYNRDKIRLKLDVKLKEGKQRVRLTLSDLSYPSSWAPESITPQSVEVNISRPTPVPSPTPKKIP